MALGEWGERRVARHYESAGYEVLDRNWRVRGGELDLVLADSVNANRMALISKLLWNLELPIDIRKEF